jgi:tRNA 2-thiocytidine biosynthesis protein TtcA
MPGYFYKSLNRDIGKAICQYDMISDGDRILVGISGGKDSLTLASILKERQSRVPVSYELFGVYIDPGFNGGFADSLQSWAENLCIRIRVESTDIGVLAHSAHNFENPCFLCSRLRRKRIFEIAEELHCNKIALGHHKDDIIETFFINICYTGVMSTMCPVQPLFKGRFTIIRPLAFVDEDRIDRFSREEKLPTFANACPYAQVSKRKEIKTFLNHLYNGDQKIKKNIFRSLSNVNLEYLP